jgi:hypothetical protein
MEIKITLNQLRPIPQLLRCSIVAVDDKIDNNDLSGAVA